MPRRTTFHHSAGALHAAQVKWAEALERDQRTRKDVRPKLGPSDVHGQDLCDIERERDGIFHG
jgi:hypothetical protein